MKTLTLAKTLHFTGPRLTNKNPGLIRISVRNAAFARQANEPGLRRTRRSSMRRRIFTALCAGILCLGSLRPASSAPSANEVVFYPGASIHFEHLSIDDGLSQNAVPVLLQDSHGYIWAGTQDGLNRFDGYTFTHFRNDPANPDSISHNSISALYEDSDGYLWVGTSGGGLNRFDPVTRKFTRYLPETGNPDSLGDLVVTTIVEGWKNWLWVGTLGGLDLLDTATGKFTHFRSNTSDPTSLSSNTISVITPTSDGKLWIGTGAFGTTGEGLNFFDPITHKAEHISPNGLCLNSSNVSSILIDRNGSLWIGHGGSGLPGGGLDNFDPATGNCQHFDINTTAGQFTNDNVIHLLIDRDGHLWISFWGGGILRMESGIPRTFSSIRHDSVDPDSLSSDNTSALLQDNSGVLWVGTFDAGINILNLENLQFRIYKHISSDPASLASNAISAFAETPTGDMWIGTEETGLAYFEPDTGQFTYYRHVPSNPDSLSSNRIMSLYADQDGSLWVGTVNSGLNHFNPITGESVRYQHDSADPASIIDDEVTYITRDNGGILWVATLAGIARLDPERGGFVNYSGLSGAPVTLATDGGDLWIGTWGGGISRLRLALPGILPADATRLSIMDTFLHSAANPNSLSENSVWAIHRTSEGLLWFGTTNGLNRYNPKTGEFKVYDENDGLRDASVSCITEDPNGDLWITTADGLARFEPRAETFLTYDRSDGLQGSEFNPNTCFYSPRTGNIYVGGTDGFTVFNPLWIVRNTTPPKVVITDFSVFNEPIPFDPHGKTPVKLSYTQNYISFNFAALDFHASAKNTYAYMLEGFDKDWVQAGTRHDTSYTSLPGGKYTFHVKAANSDGTWSTSDTTLQIQIIPPLWKRWQFLLGLGLGLVLLFVAGFQWRLMAVRASARSLEKSIVERTGELNKANELLREKATQDAVAAERTRLARDLHDAVTQTLFSATLIAEVLPDLWEKNRPEGDRRLEELRQLTRGALAEMRTLLVELRPNALIEIPLPTLLRQLTDALIGRARIAIQLNCSGERKLPADVQVGLYRIAQESLNNIVKHARATQAVVTLQMGEPVRLTIADNGTGFNPATVMPDHIGLRIMRERAEAIGAQFKVESTPGEGTQISVILEGKDPPVQEAAHA
jgi:signal transduction histidine kinase/ligand-binding sensor domain-containing protein